MGKKRLTVVSLFSGCGGLDSGFEAAGFDILSAHDIDPVAVRNYNENLKPVGVISDVSSKDFNIPQGVDVIISGSPCQGFSLVGKREIFDPRNSLLLTACELVKKAAPRAVIFENVPGALSGEHKGIWDKAVQMLQKQGYQVSYEILSLNDYGIAQMRKRVFLVALRGATPPPFFNLILKEPPPTLKKTLDSAHLFSSGDLFLPLDKNGTDFQIAQRIGQGMKLCDVRAGERSVHSWNIPEVFGSTTKAEREILMAILKLRRQVRRRSKGDADPVDVDILISQFGSSVVVKISKLVQKEYLTFDGKYVDLKRRFNGKYRRFSWESPSYTVDTNFGNPRYFLHPIDDRGFSVREAARIQGFPDSYKFSGTVRDQFRIIGNAVPPPVAKKIAQQLLLALKN